MKDELRRKFKTARAGLTPDQRKASDAAICKSALSQIEKFNSFFIYNSFGSEADTHTLINELIARSKEVYLPRIDGKEMKAVRFSGNFKELSVNKFGIAEPLGQVYEGGLDVIVAPLLAINSRLCRLGYGGGYYDKFLSGTKALKVGLGYHFQLTDEFEEDEWDVPLDMFINDKGIIKL